MKKHNFSERLSRIQQVVLLLFLVVFFFVYTFYLGDGYYLIGDYKYEMYQRILFVFLLIEAVLFVLFRLSRKKKQNVGYGKGISWEREDIFLLCYAIVMILSTIGACDKKTALFGYPEWFLGIFMMLSFLFLYVVFAKTYCFSMGTIVLYLVSGAVMCLLGYLQRCGINLLPSQGYDQEGFSLSTLGNINWICGYLAVYYPLCMGLLITYLQKKTEKRKKTVTAFLVVLYLVSTGFLVLQGSESGWLILLMCWVAYFWYGATIRRRTAMDAYLKAMLLGFLGIGVTSQIYYYRITHGVASYWGLNQIMYSKAWFVLAFLVGLLLFVRRWIQEEKGIFAATRFDRYRKVEQRIFKMIRNVMVIAGVAGCLGILFIIVGYQISPQKFAWAASYQKLMFDYEWGHGRGAIWRSAWSTYLNGNLWRRLFGYGPDCYYYATNTYGNGMYLEIFRETVTTDAVANAHNELLNILVNSGVFGLLSYLGFLGSLLITFYQAAFPSTGKKGNHYAFMGVVIIVVMTIHNLVSFEQIEATPYFFLLLGILRAGVQEQKEAGTETVSEYGYTESGILGN